MGAGGKPAMSGAVGAAFVIGGISVTRDTLWPLVAVTVIGVGSVDGDPYVSHYGVSSSGRPVGYAAFEP